MKLKEALDKYGHECKKTIFILDQDGVFIETLKKVIIILFVSVMLFGCTDEIEKRELRSFVLNGDRQSESHGNYFLFVGHFTQKSSMKTKYYFFVKGKEGYRLQELESNKVEIVEKDNIKKPYIKGYFNKNGEVDDNDYAHYIVYVPKGTIKEGYDVDIREVKDEN